MYIYVNMNHFVTHVKLSQHLIDHVSIIFLIHLFVFLNCLVAFVIYTLTHKVFCFLYLKYIYNYLVYVQYMGLLWWISSKQSTCQCRRYGFDPWIEKIPWIRKWQPTPLFLPGKSNRQRSLAGYGPWRHKSQTRPSN